MLTEDSTESIKGNVSRISAEPKTAPKGGYLFRGLEVDRQSARERAFLIIPEFARKDLYDFPLLCWQGCYVAAYGLSLNNRLKDGTLILVATPESEIILEPYRPVSITEAVEATACIRSVDIRYRVGPEEPFWMAKGRLIHSLFDHLLAREGPSAPSAFENAFQAALPALKAVLPGSRIATDLASLEREARTHFDNLRDWLSDNRNLFFSAEVELDRISSRMGLKGRTDAILRNQDRRTIVELKSGKVPVDDHALQLFGYSMILDEIESQLPVDGLVLYSATGRTERLDKRRADWRDLIVEGRNKVVALRHSYLTESPEPVIPICPNKGRCFSRVPCQHLFGSSASGKGPLLKGEQPEYYNRWFRLLSRDAWAQEGEFARVLDQQTLAERINEGVTLAINEARVASAGDSSDRSKAESGRAQALLARNVLPIELVFSGIVSDIRPGEEVIVHRGDPCRGDAFRGTVIESENGRMTVGLKIPFSDGGSRDVPSQAKDEFERPGNWFLDRIPFSRGRDVSRHALYSFFLNADPGVKMAVVPARTVPESIPDNRQTCRSTAKKTVKRSARTDDLYFGEGLNHELNEDQEAAVSAALNSETYHLIHGPPGTGKTRVLARLLRLCLDRGERVLVACPTNVALDRILISLMQLGVDDFLRVGGRGLVSEEFLETLDKSGNPPVLLDDLCSLPMDFSEFRRIVASRRLVGATAYQASAHPVLRGQKFHRVVVDEAGQLDEPSTLGPLTMAKRFVLGGDHLQLPPVVKERGDDAEMEYASGLELSLFERLFHCAPAERISRLTIQYRMNSEVQEIPSRLFYGSSLVPFPDVAGRRLNICPGVSENPEINRIIDPELPVVFVDVQGPDSGKGSPLEADIACRLVRSLIASGVGTQDIGIITPYRAQQALIRSLLSSRSLGGRFLSVDTVDRFQGGEKEVIILSMARSDGVTSFLADRKRLNVSLSRARSKLILLGHGPALQEHPLFASVLEGLDRIKITGS